MAIEVAPAPNPATPSTSEAIIAFVKQHFVTFMTTLVTGVLAACSGCIVEQVKFSLNKADLRTKQYEGMALEVSKFVFATELSEEFLDNNWTRKKTIEWLIGDYNAAITKLRQNEYVYMQWLAHYWSQEKVDEFKSLMVEVKAIDKIIHKLNDELDKFVDEKTAAKYERLDAARTKETAKQLKPHVKELQTKAEKFLTGLQ